MLYNVNVYARIPSINKTIEASSRKEAEDILAQMIKESKENIHTLLENVEVSGSVSVSSQNYTYNMRMIYLVKRYSSLVPAICTTSLGANGTRRAEHIFKYLDTRKEFSVRGPKPHSRVIKKLCNVNAPRDENCTNCEARFLCFVSRDIK